jgi:hypothetical protein
VAGRNRVHSAFRPEDAKRLQAQSDDGELPEDSLSQSISLGIAKYSPAFRIKHACAWAIFAGGS